VHPMTQNRRGGRRRLVSRGSLTALLTVGLIAPVGLASAAAEVPTAEPMPAAAGWVATQLASTDAPSAVELADAILAFAATGSAGDAGDAALADLAALGPDATRNAGDAAKTVLAASVQGADPSDLDGFDAEAALRGTMEASGRFPLFGTTQLFVQSLAILALETTEDGAPAEAVTFLADRVCPSNGAVSVPGTCPAGDVDTTAVAAQALAAAGRDVSPMVTFLRGRQRGDGSFGPAGDENTNSTALAAQALRLAGEVDAADRALSWVLDRQKGCDAPAADRGSFATYPDADGNVRIATTQAVFAASSALHELDASTSAAETAFLRCLTDAPCPAGAGVSVVVDFTSLLPDADPFVTCVEGPVSAGTSGHDLLEAAQFAVTYASFSFGDSVCQIDGRPTISAGDPRQTCFEQGYWSYWSAEAGGEWEAYEVGGGDSRPAEGSFEGWSWAPGFEAAPPRVAPARRDDPPLPEPPYDRGIAKACPGTYPRTFDDTAGSVHERAIRCLASAGITQGTREGRYAPRDAVSRAQLASFLARTYRHATGQALPAGRQRFTDVRGSVHERNINALAEAGVIAGVGDGTRFAPNQTVTRGQMAALLARLVDLLDDGRVNGSFPPATDRDVFRDDDGSVHERAIDRLAVQGVVQGRRDGTYGPQHGVTRDQLASFLARALDLAVDAGHARPVR
jgi:hypothetical protein